MKIDVPLKNIENSYRVNQKIIFTKEEIEKEQAIKALIGNPKLMDFFSSANINLLKLNVETEKSLKL